MLFSSATFLFAFLPTVTLLYYIIPARFRTARNMLLTLVSILFCEMLHRTEHLAERLVKNDFLRLGGAALCGGYAGHDRRELGVGSAGRGTG